MPSLNVLIVHPSPEIRAEVRAHVQEVEFLRVLGEAADGREALDLLTAVGHAVCFTGLSLPGDLSGFELAQMLATRGLSLALVFLAEDESQAFQAFELNATDFLLTPFSEARFARTTERLRQFKSHYKLVAPPETSWQEDAEGLGETEEENTLRLPLGEEEQEHFLSALRQAWDFSKRAEPMEIEKLPIQLEGRTILLPYDQIVFVEAYEDYSYVHTNAQKFLTSYRLKVLEDRLRPYRFFRVHRKYLVNLDMVTEIGSLPGSNFMLRTAGKTRIELPISRRRINELKQVLGL